MEITQEQWDELVNKVNGFSTQIEELKTENTNLTTKNGEYEQKLQEWQTLLSRVAFTAFKKRKEVKEHIRRYTRC